MAQTKICVDEKWHSRKSAWTKNGTDENLRGRKMAQTKFCVDENMHRRKNIRTKKMYGRKNIRTKKCTDERMHRRKIVQTKKCETKISTYEKLRDEKVRDEKIFRRKTADEKQQTEKCQTKKCQTKNGHGIKNPSAGGDDKCGAKWNGLFTSCTTSQRKHNLT